MTKTKPIAVMHFDETIGDAGVRGVNCIVYERCAIRAGYTSANILAVLRDLGDMGVKTVVVTESARELLGHEDTHPGIDAGVYTLAELRQIEFIRNLIEEDEAS